MAHRKRSRDPSDIDGDIEIESASSSFRQTLNPKRSRIALAQQRGGSVVSDDDDGSHDDDGMHGGTASIRGGTAEVEQFTEDDIENVELDELQMTQMVANERQQHKGNIAAESGIIQEVYCRNFMCHSKLRITLGPNINFIIGHNGSGKSAVLTALTMCLGGKATTTNRGGSLKSLIKEGQDSASLAVKIKNQGEGAYKPELYGRSITVERNFTRAGTSGFKLKNAEDRVISTKKTDLDDILDFFAFQLDNPINVLTQDMARQFLSNSSASDKYKFFIRGTQLEALDADYKLLEEHLDGIEAKLRSRIDDVDFLKQKLDEAERKKGRLEKSDSIRQKVTQYQNMYAWAQVEREERSLEVLRERVEEAEHNVRSLEEEASTVGAEFEGTDQSYTAAERTLQDLRTEVAPLQDAYDEQKASFDSGREKLTQRLAEERDIRGVLTSTKVEVARVKKQIADEEALLAGAEGNEHTARLERLEQLKEAAETAVREQLEHGKGSARLETQRIAAFEERRKAEAPLNQCRDAKQRAEANLNRTRAEQPRPFAGFRPNMETLVKAIDRETRWRSKPVGPMGLHVKLLKPEWSSQIEKTLGGALESFIVSCKEDQTLLNALMKKVSCNTAVYIGDPAPLDTTGKEPEEGVNTILRSLDIDNHAVRNQLIINNLIEQTALIADLSEAQTFMFHGPRPHNVKATLCKYDKGYGSRLDRTGRGAEKNSTIEPFNGAPRMKSDRETQIHIQQENVMQARRALDEAEKEFRSKRDAGQKANQEIERFKRRQSELKAAKETAEDKVEALENEIESLRPQDGKLQALRENLRTAQDELEGYENSFKDMVNEKDRLNGVQTERKARVEGCQKQLDEANRRILKAEKRRDQVSLSRDDALRRKNRALEDVKAGTDGVEEAKHRRDRQQVRVRDEFEVNALRICERVAVLEGLEPETIDHRLRRFEQEAARAEEEAGGSREELLTAWQKAREDHADAMAQMQSMDQMAELLKRTLNNRQGRWKIFRGLISGRARINFIYLLSERSFRGNVYFDHHDKELDISVEPDTTKDSDRGRAARTLSGGEKSFSTICLLLSIWEAMGSPIRCLDEFDVFMDSVNRATSMKMMVEAARRAVGRQFILITPQSMNNVNWGDDVHVNKMSDPERGQTTLPFGN